VLNVNPVARNATNFLRSCVAQPIGLIHTMKFSVSATARAATTTRRAGHFHGNRCRIHSTLVTEAHTKKVTAGVQESRNRVSGNIVQKTSVTSEAKIAHHLNI
jgi:hypothetical protein